MEGKDLAILGGVVIGGIVLVMLARKSTTQAQNTAYLQSQALQQQYELQRSTSGQVGSVLGSVGGFLNSGALQNIFSSFSGNSEGQNDPGLGLNTYESDPASNEPDASYAYAS